jgi:hypothetical protein
VSHDLKVTAASASFTFNGKAVALMGTIGERCCEAGHARVFVDGVETTNTVGVWQNKSSPGRPMPNSVLFAWRWPEAGSHKIEIRPGVKNAKEGSSFFHMVGYKFVK